MAYSTALLARLQALPIREKLCQGQDMKNQRTYKYQVCFKHLKIYLDYPYRAIRRQENLDSSEEIIDHNPSILIPALLN